MHSFSVMLYRVNQRKVYYPQTCYINIIILLTQNNNNPYKYLHKISFLYILKIKLIYKILKFLASPLYYRPTAISYFNYPKQFGAEGILHNSFSDVAQLIASGWRISFQTNKIVFSKCLYSAKQLSLR